MPERTIVTVDADHLARTEFTPDDFDFLLDCAEVGLEGAPEVFSSDRERADRRPGVLSDGHIRQRRRLEGPKSPVLTWTELPV